MSDTDILVIPAEHSPGHSATGAWSLGFDPEREGHRWRWPDDYQWLPRAQAEQDERFLQIIPYALLVNSIGEIWCYRRLGGDARLRERFSCGVGGHIERIDDETDFSTTVQRTLRRELAEELGWQLPASSTVPAHAWIFEGLTAVGRVHLGLVFLIPWTAADEPRPLESEGMASLGFWPTARILEDERFELWSRLALSPSVNHASP